MEMYMVGGAVRDSILGVPSKDIDFSVVLGEYEKVLCVQDQIKPFDFMVRDLKRQGFKIFLESPEFLTVRAQFPKGWKQQSFEDAKNGNAALTADFVLARKESDYKDGRRPDKVEPGTLEDDLARRDFTMNAIAKDKDGSYIDPFNGRADIEARIIRAVGDPFERLTEDALRAVRALRFSVTKDFTIDPELAFAMKSMGVAHRIELNIADDRIRSELEKMFRYDTMGSLRALQMFPSLTRAVFSGSVSLDATMKTKGRG